MSEARTASTAPADGERGFSLVEMLVAVVVTLIISGAIYALLTSGQTAFRREPELADRQQNIRIAMDLIAKDIANAGAAMPALAQSFTAVDPGGTALNAQGPEGSLGPAPATARGSDATASDVLEIVSSEERCPSITICSPPSPTAAGGLFVGMERIPGCMTDLAVVTDNGGFMVLPITSPSPGTPGSTSAICPSGNIAGNSNILLGGALAPWATPSPAFSAQSFLFPGRVVRYQLAPSNDPTDVAGAPALWRSTTGRYDLSGGAVNTVPAPPGPNWQLVARGLEDLQIEYMDGTGTWTNGPRQPILGPVDVVRQVRVTLAARTSAQNLQGATRAGAGTGVAPDAIRGQLVSIVTPRAALVGLQLLGQLQ